MKSGWAAALLSVPLSLAFAIVFWLSYATHASSESDEDDSYGIGLLAGLTWLPGGLFAMVAGAVFGRFLRRALRRYSWKSEVAVIEDLREDYARRQAGDGQRSD